MRRLLLFSFLTLVITGAYLNYLEEEPGYIMGTALVTIDRSKPFMTSQFSTGITHTQDDIELSGGTAATAAARLLQSSMTYQNAFIMGWGTDDPEPSPGQYDWDSLDSYVKLMTATGGTPFISFCCAPGWMRPDGFSDDWQYIETAPAPYHDADFAALAATVAKRYPQVQYFQVWNELKGMWGTDPDATPDVGNHWDYKRYTTFYNAVYDAVKAVRPDARIGGPYLGADPIDAEGEAIYSYWLNNKHGADFIVLDGGPEPFRASDEFNASSYFADWVNWLRKQPNGGATLPIGWAEWYPRTSHGTSDVNRASAIFLSDMIVTIQAGVSYAFPWGVSGDDEGLTGDPAFPVLPMTDEGQPTPVFAGIKAVKDYFSVGTPLYKTTVKPGGVTVLASQAKTMLVNQCGFPLDVIANGKPFKLAPYQIDVVDTP